MPKMVPDEQVKYVGLGAPDDRRYFGFGRSERFNALAWAAAWAIPIPPWVTYNPVVQWQYRITRGQSSDGTYALTMLMIGEALQPVCDGVSYWKPSGFRAPMRYVIGNARITTVYTGHPLRGIRQRIRIPVLAIPG